MLKNGNAVVKATVAISGKEQLAKLLERLKKVDQVVSVARI